MKILITFAATLWVLLTSCSKIEEPQFRAVEKFRVVSFGLEEVTIGFGMRYFNPNDFTVTVKETEADIYLDEVFLGRFTQDANVEVGRETDFTVLLTGSIPMSTFLRMNLKDIHRREIVIRAEGKTKVGKAGVFITRSISYQGRHQLDKVRL